MAAAACGEEEPAEQGVQATAPGGEMKPAAQALHALEPVTLANLPAGHCWQPPPPPVALAKLPAGQAEQKAAAEPFVA